MPKYPMDPFANQDEPWPESELHRTIDALISKAIAAERQRLCAALRKAADELVGRAVGAPDALERLADELERP